MLWVCRFHRYIYIYIHTIYPRASLKRVLLSCLLWDVGWHASFFQEPAWNIFIFLLHVWYWLLYKLHTSFIQEPVWRIWFDYVVYLWVSFCQYLTQAGGMVKIFVSFLPISCPLSVWRIWFDSVVLGDSGGVVKSLDFCPASLKSLGCFYFRCVLSSRWKVVTVNLRILLCQL